LKRRKLGGYKFTRQFSIGPYFADFVCREKWLAIELDGSQHADSSYDRRRDEVMRSFGYSVLRFWSHEVLKQRRAICEAILAALEGRLTEDVTAFDMRFVFASNSGTAGAPMDRPPLRHASRDTSPPFDGERKGGNGRIHFPLIRTHPHEIPR
jgi:very-short-patch-repair endonuclease